MNGQSTPIQAKKNATEYGKPWQEAKQWKEADRCNGDRPIRCDQPKKPDCDKDRGDNNREVIRERDKETFIWFNAAESSREHHTRRDADTISKLAWLLLGLASLLFLGSMFMLLAYGRSTNTTTIKEITNNTNKSREIIRVETDNDDVHLNPKALW